LLHTGRHPRPAGRSAAALPDRDRGPRRDRALGVAPGSDRLARRPAGISLAPRACKR